MILPMVYIRCGRVSQENVSFTAKIKAAVLGRLPFEVYKKGILSIF